MSVIQEPYVIPRIENGIGVVEFFHPASNSLPGRILQELAETIIQIGKDERVKVIILKSAGEKAFCAGASFDELIAIQDEQDGKIFFSGFASVINAMRTSPCLIIARIQGKAVGGGVGLAAAADYAIATKAASIKLSELAVGIGPFVVGPAVERKIGLSAFSELAIDATSWRSADWALQKGLFTQIHPDIPQMDEAIRLLADRLSQSNPEAMTELKRIFWQGTEHWERLLIERAGTSGALVLGDFTRNAIAQFKRK